MPTALHEERLDAVTDLLVASGATRVLDLGCGSGELLRRLADHSQLTRLVGIDIDPEAVAEARAMLGVGFLDPAARIQVRHGSFEQPDPDLVAELAGFDAAALVETLEHIDPDRLSRVEQACFQSFRPRMLLVTTPNQDYNELHGLAPDELRHPDHRFEWGRARFRYWAGGVARRNGYEVRFVDIGPVDRLRGSSTQMAVYTLPWHRFVIGRGCVPTSRGRSRS